MSFPQTRHTLIERIALGGDEGDWARFLADYWAPVCRFARRSGAPTWEDAEDAASQTFAALLKNQLLARWSVARSAKLRTLLCAVVRNTLANHARVETRRAELLREEGPVFLPPSAEAAVEQEDAFYAAWVEDLVCRAIDRLMKKLHEQGRGDHFRVLHGRICEEMTFPEIAAALHLTTTQAESAYRQARQHLAEDLKDLLRFHVSRYCPPDDVAEEFAAEWTRLGEHLLKHDRLEAEVRRSLASNMPPRTSNRHKHLPKDAARESGR